MSISKSQKEMSVRLLCISSAMIILNTERCFSRVDLKELVHDIYDDVTDNLLPLWLPEELTFEDVTEIWNIVHEIENRIVEGKMEFKDAVTVTTTASFLIADALDVTQNKPKVAALERVREKIEILHNFVDREGLHFPSMERADQWLKPFREVITQRVYGDQR